MEYFSKLYWFFTIFTTVFFVFLSPRVECKATAPTAEILLEESTQNLTSFRQDEVAEPAYIEELRNRMDDIYDDLQRIKLSLFVNQNQNNSLDLRIIKCAGELSESNEVAAAKYWEEIQIYLTTYDQAKAIATKLIDRVDLTSRTNVLPMIIFAEYMNVPQAYDTLITKLKNTGHFYGGSETFLLAENIKKVCGIEQTVFKTLPQILRDITASKVTIQNKWNRGYLYYQSDPENFFTWFSPHKHRNHYDQLDESRKPRGHWEFILQGDKMKIVNSFNRNELIDKKTIFAVELVNESEIRLKVVESGKAGIIGKYLVGKARNKGEQFTQITFMDMDAAVEDQFRWTAQPVEKRGETAKVQRC